MNEIDARQIESLLTIRDKNFVAIQVSLFATIYYYGAHLPELQRAVAKFVEEFQQVFGSELRWAKDPSTFRYSLIESRKVPSLKDWFSRLEPNAGWEYELRGGNAADEATAASVEAVGRPNRGLPRLSYLKFTLPMTWFASHQGSFPQLLKDACDMIHPEHGYGGLGFNESPKLTIRERYEPDVFALAVRFPGVEVDEPVAHINFLRDGIKGGNWLTVLSDSYLERLGGRSKLEGDLGRGFTLHQYSGGLIIQAGERPQMGDAEKGQVPLDYVRLARLLKPIRVTIHGPFQHTGPNRFDRAASEAWLSRFDAMPQ
jgi:hypothetical protein